MSDKINESFIILDANLLNAGHYSTAISLANTIFLLATELESDILKRLALESLELSTHQLLSLNDKGVKDNTKLSEIGRTCSFCGQGEPAVKLFAGANAFICNDCVQSAHTAYTHGTD